MDDLVDVSGIQLWLCGRKVEQRLITSSIEFVEGSNVELQHGLSKSLEGGGRQ